MEQHLITKRYCDTIVTRVRRITGATHDASWHPADNVTSPLAAQVDAYRETLTKRLEDLQTTADSRQTVQQRIDALRRKGTRLQAQIGTLNRVSEALIRKEQVAPAQVNSQPRRPTRRSRAGSFTPHGLVYIQETGHRTRRSHRRST